MSTRSGGRASGAGRKSKSKSTKVDLYAKHRNEYAAGKTPALVRVGPARYLSISGHSAPQSPEFTRAIGALFGVAYTVRMAKKAAGSDYAVARLEALWWPDAGASEPPSSGAAWNWQLLIRVPTFVSARDVRTAAEAMVARGKDAEVKRVEVVELREGECVQILHVGPYDAEAESIGKMRDFAAKAGRRFSGRHHEIYLSDPQRVEPARLKTILRMPVA